MSDHDDLQSKIAQAKVRLPFPDLLAKLGLSDHAKKSGRCPFHKPDNHPSFSVFKGQNGFWLWKCQAGCGEGDEISFISQRERIPLSEAISRYLEMAGFPRSRPDVSLEYPESRCVSASLALPESPAFPVSPCVSVSPVSEGQAAQGASEQELKTLAARNVCTNRKRPDRRRFKLAQDLAAVEKRIGGSLTLEQIRIAAYEWYRLSKPYFNAEDSRKDHLTALVAEIGKVLFPTGENRLAIAIEKVSQLPVVDLPVIPGCLSALEEWRRIAALHRELWVISGGKQYFLSYRDAAKVVPGLCHQKAHHITLALKRFGVIDIVNNGQPGSSGKAAEFLYLLPERKAGLLHL